jgi:hypothetical protein
MAMRIKTRATSGRVTIVKSIMRDIEEVEEHPESYA